MDWLHVVSASVAGPNSAGVGGDHRMNFKPTKFKPQPRSCPEAHHCMHEVATEVSGSGAIRSPQATAEVMSGSAPMHEVAAEVAGSGAIRSLQATAEVLSGSASMHEVAAEVPGSGAIRSPQATAEVLSRSAPLHA